MHGDQDCYGFFTAASHLEPKNSLICSNTTPCRTLNVLSTAVADHSAPLAAVDPLTSPHRNAALTALPFSNETIGSIVNLMVWVSWPSFAERRHSTLCLPILASYFGCDIAAAISALSRVRLASHCALPQ